MNCCNDFGHCERGAECPVRATRPMTHATNPLPQPEPIIRGPEPKGQQPRPLETANSDGSSPFADLSPDLPADWRDEVRHLALWAALLVTLAGTLGLLAGYHFGR